MLTSVGRRELDAVAYGVMNPDKVRLAHLHSLSCAGRGPRADSLPLSPFQISPIIISHCGSGHRSVKLVFRFFSSSFVHVD